MTKIMLSTQKLPKQISKAKQKEMDEAPWRLYCLHRMAKGDDARELFKF